MLPLWCRPLRTPLALALLWALACPAHAAAVAVAAGSDAGADAGSEAGADLGAVDTASDDATATAFVEFDPSLLQFPVDVSMFAQGNALPAGNYRVDLNTNGEWKGRVVLRFAMLPGNDRVAQPCYDTGLLETLGFDLKHLKEDVRATMAQGEQVCRPLGALIAGSKAQYHSGELKLDVSAPQIVLRREARGFVDPALWDHGITAGTLDYSYNGYRSQNPYSGSSSSHYLSLRAGLNMGAWRLRYRAAANHSERGGFHYRGHTAYAERAIPQWKSRMTVGETASDGEVFDSVLFRGVRLDSDERMRPDSQRGFAPIVRGIAQTSAKVSIHQLGQEIYQTNVPPGAFVIDDLYPTGMSGDLIVTITESDGSVRSFTVAYAGTAQLVRPGSTHYSLAAGRYENAGMVHQPMFATGNVRRGLSNAMTGYTGLMVGEGYQALAGGLAFNTRIGALATDFTFASTRTAIGNYRGSSARVTWAKVLPVTNTQVNVASYRYSSQGYYDPAAAFMLRDQVAYGIGGGGILPGLLYYARAKNRLVANISQSLPGRWGHFSLSLSSQDYWAQDGRDTQYQLGWNRQIMRLSMGLSASRMRNVFLQRWEDQYMLNMSMPLGGGLYANSSYSHGERMQTLNTSVSGTAGEQHQFGFGAYFNASRSDWSSTQTSGGANASWNTSLVQMSANMSASRGGNRQVGVSLNGGMVAFGGGIVLSPRLGETIAIVEAKGAGGARIGNGGRGRLNRNGHAVVPHLNAYRMNRISIDPKGISTDVALATTSHRVAPTAGAVALLRYETERGYSLLLNARYADGRYLPFASAVTDEHGRNVGYLAQGGQGLLRVNATSGTLTVRWGSEAGQSCQFQYSVHEGNRKTHTADGPHDFRHVEAVCTDESSIATTTTGDTLR